MAELTPMMRQYMEIKEQNPDSILFFRLGDFYEMFGPDARTASRELDLALTTRDKDKTKSFDDKIPMCGIPYHASDAYIARLIAKGYKVAICEQTEDPAAAKGLVKRDIIRVVTPGTVIDESCLSAERSNYLCGVYLDDTGAGLCACDVSTGKAQATVFTGPDRVRALLNELGRFSPAEAVMNETAFFDETLHQALRERFSCHLEKLPAARFTPEEAEKKVRAQFGQDALERLPRDNMTPLLALGGVTIFIFVERFMAIRKASVLDMNFMNRIRDYISDGKISTAVNLCKKTDTPIARMIEKGIERIGRPMSDVQTAIENVANLEVSKLENGLPFLATIAGGAPMIGFLGTVLGMVQTFMDMSAAGGTVDLGLLSSGMYVAMVTTVMGLIVGIPAYFGYNYLVARIEKLVFQMEANSIAFMDILNQPVQK